MTELLAGLSERQRDLVQGAVRVLDRQGLDGCTMRTLAAEIGLSPMAAYKHFQNQRELLLEVWRVCMQGFSDQVMERAPLAPPADDPAAEFLGITREVLRYATVWPYRFQFIFFHPFIQEVRQEPRFTELRLRLWVYGSRVVREARDRGLLRDDISSDHLLLLSMSISTGLGNAIVSSRVDSLTGLGHDEVIDTGLRLLAEAVMAR